MEGINYFINMPVELTVYFTLVALLCCVIVFLYYRFSHLSKKVRFNINQSKFADTLGPTEWVQQLLEISGDHKNVKAMRYNFILDDYNQSVYKKLNRIRNHISEIPADIIALIPAARWLFDNFQMMYREIKKFRASGTSYEMLPILKNKEHHGFPRVYILAKKMVALSNGHLHEESITTMLNAYQKEIPLTDKELWVLPELLGFCLLESIVGVSEDVIRIIKLKSKADKFVRAKLGMEKTPEGFDINNLLCDIEDDCKEDFSFHAQVIYLLKNMSVDGVSIQKYLDYHFEFKHKKLKPSDIFTEEGKIESYIESNIRALVNSLREISEVDSEQFFEQFSYLEQILSKDPDGIYHRMDSESRGMYRGIIVELSLKYKMDEVKIVNTCLELAKQGRDDIHNSHHVGTYLIGKGYPILKGRVLNKEIPEEIKKKTNVKGIFYFVSYFGILLGLSFVLMLIMYRENTMESIYPYVLIMLIALPLLIGITLEITNFIFTRRIRVKKIPSLDYHCEIPDQAKTFVVMPVIVSSAEQGLEYLNRLQKHYLANRQPNLYFALLADFEDAKEEFMPKDEKIEAALCQQITRLNEQYPSKPQRFSLFLRFRKWNPSENCFMCWERKRGKLEEFNHLLNGTPKEETSFSTIVCDSEQLNTFRYVITLDADTNLLRDNAAKLVGLIDHPLNNAILDKDGKNVEEGYVIIQPSVRNHIVEVNGSCFAKLFGGQSGLAHYGTVISDIYQDIFNKGIYIGKGIYNVKAFHSLLHDRIPENSVLSHDLLESCYARTAFSSSAKVMDTFPNSVISYGKREHRWIRGDWQLLPWLFRTKDACGRNICLLSKWKIFDNLRRSIVPISKILFIFVNLIFLPKTFYLWLPLIFFNDLFNLIILIISIITQKIIRPKLALVYKGLLKEIFTIIRRVILEFVITPYRAYIAIDAIIQTICRLYISKKNLLKWNTAESVDSSVINTWKGYFFTMWTSFIPAVFLLLVLLGKDLSVLGIILYSIIALLWGMAFYIAYLISQPKKLGIEKNQTENHELLLNTARHTWMFFKEFSTKENHWLCPDNYQLSNEKISHMKKVSNKTSPTNIGLQFLSILCARDLGFDTLSGTIDRIENLMNTIDNLPKWKGHLYNWYQIDTLEILTPEYISTVDSGNFFGHLIAVKNGLLEQINTPIFPNCLISELSTALKLSKCGKDLKEKYNTIGEFVEDIADVWEDINHKNSMDCGKSSWAREVECIMESMVTEAAAYQIKNYSLSECPSLKQLQQFGNKAAKTMIERIHYLCKKIDHMQENVDFLCLYNSKRMLFHIGYHVPSETLDAGCYDLMASECSLTSFMAIARGEVPLKHWYKLGRPLTMVKGIPCFVSWSGTMFEYLMSNLVLREYEGSVYAETSKAAVLQQIKYADEMGIPWGISESQYYRFDLNTNYQYKAFGVSKLRLQPVRKNSMVVTPYATMLALEYAEDKAFDNLKRLMQLGVFGEYGYYEAIDYNSPDSVEMTPYCIVKSFMTHHQGMILVAINNYLNQGLIRKRFHNESMVKATEVLLEEKRQSHLISIAKRGYTIKVGKAHDKVKEYTNRYVNHVVPEIPVTNYLSNNKYSLLITSDGDGFSSYRNTMLYRWRADVYANTGNYIYIKDLSKGKLWSVTYHPVRKEPDEYQVIFSPHQAEFTRKDGDFTSHTVVSLSPNHNIEIRKVTLTNHGKEASNLELTSYLEVVGDSHMAELSHPAFNKLFMESEFLEEQGIFLSKRRSSNGKVNPYICHMVKTGAKQPKKMEYENDRLKFIGRNNTLRTPEAVVDSISFSNKSGFCNDPIMSIRVTIALEVGESASISFVTGVCHNKEEAIQIGEELSFVYRVDEMFEKFRLQKMIELKYLDITKTQLNAFQDLISPIFYPSCYYRGPNENIRRNFKNQTFLWKFGVSGDNPIMLLRIKSIKEAGLIGDVLKAYEYLRINRVKVDLILLSEAKHGYVQELDDLINDLTSSLRIYDSDSDRPSLFLLHAYQMIPAEVDLLYTIARIVFTEKTGIYFRNIIENLNE